MTAKHFDEMPEQTLLSVTDTIKAALKGMIEGIEQAGYCPCCFCHLVSHIATETANDYGTIIEEKKPNVAGTNRSH